MSVIWELDFYSRPVLDENNRKRWEVLICESPTSVDVPIESLFRYSKFCNNTEVNSVWLREAIEEAIAQASVTPDRIRFFRRQMNNMIVKGCEDAGITASASRRTPALSQWIESRMQDVYPSMPNYQASNNPSVAYPLNVPQPLPDALEGEKWTFVSLPASDLVEMTEWEIGFGEAFPLEFLNVSSDQAIPGLLIFSSRAEPLAAWMSGLELAFVQAMGAEGKAPPRLILETGVSDAWTLANLSTTALAQEGQQFEMAKKNAQGGHFLAIQSSPESESFAGFWLMKELHLA
ncbi:MAG: Tab2/Atab2 family RNA-binding protein [Leptolyngbyaceae bacterium]|nr:Tab2/Atab2 family RNA-binding protein [Leptolyngbyaceae bacterium]